MVIEFDIAAPQPMVWEYSPCRASGQNGEVRMRCAKRWKAAAEGVGTTNHCMHGAHVKLHGKQHSKSLRVVSVAPDRLVAMTVEDSKPLLSIGWTTQNILEIR